MSILNIQPTPEGHGDKWQCQRCHSWNDSQVTRCSFCSNPKQAVAPTGPSQEEINLTARIHQAVERLNFMGKKRLYSWMEDNIL